MVKVKYKGKFVPVLN